MARRLAPVHPPSGSAEFKPLVNADEELIAFLAEAERLVKDGAYSRAIQILQALVARGDSGFVPVDTARYFGLGTKATEIIGRMGPEGLKFYRGLHDGEAQAIFDKAVSTGDLGLFHRVVRQYLHTSFGARAVDELGARYFDMGRFAQAAYCWRQALGLRPAWVSQGLLLARIACASHLAGDSAEAQEALQTLRKDFPNAREILAGRSENVVGFVETFLKTPSAALRQQGEVSRNWPGLGGVPTGLAVMPDCDVVLVPRWVRRADGDSPDGFGLMTRLMASGPLAELPGRRIAAAKVRCGHVRAELNQSGQQMVLHLPGVIHPVVAGNNVIYRTDDQVVACDLLTGEQLWRVDGLPMVRSDALMIRPYSGSYYYYGSVNQAVGDSGRYMLTAGDGKVFVRYGFLPAMRDMSSMMQMMGRDPNLAKMMSDTSALAAIGVGDARGGQVLWRIGSGVGDNEVVSAGTFASPPTYHAGRLYVVMFHAYRYYMVCLDAETGRAVWRTAICQPPTTSSTYYGYEGLGIRTQRCSPPAVSDGRVFALPNIGVLVALDAEAGQPLWAYHYESVLNPSGSTRGSSAYALDPGARSVNPVIVSGRRVVILPSDSDSVVAVRCDDGTQLWRAGRSGLSDLSAIDGDRFLLSGPGLAVLSAEGKELHRAAPADAVIGRPAVTRSAALASGSGKIYRLDLKSYELTKTDLGDADGLLGNLVSTGDALIAANPAGLCAYFRLEVIRARLDERISGADPQTRARLLFRKAQLAFNAKAFDDAMKDLIAGRELARQLEDTALAEQMRTWIYRSLVALGNCASDGQKMRAYFEKGLEIAATAQEQAHMKLRLAKVYEKTGELSAVAALEQEISESFGSEELVDVQIGAEADQVVRFGEGTQRYSGKELGQKIIRKLLEVHGRGPYAEFDRIASQALTAAKAAKDPAAMQAVYDRWPNSTSADGALYSAAEAYADMAKASGGAQADKYLQEARNLLSIVAKMSDSPLRLAAGAAMAVLYARNGKIVTAGDWCDKVRLAHGFDARMQVEFSDVRGGLGDILAKVQRGQMMPAREQDVEVGFIDPPLQEVFFIADETVRLLRDQEFRPVRLGEKLLALQGDRAILLDTSAQDTKTAVAWSALAPIESAQMASTSGYPGYLVAAGLSGDRNIVVIAAQNEARGYDVKSGKVVWQRGMSALGVSATQKVFSVGEGVLLVADSAGRLVCLDVASGDVRWEAFVRGGTRVPSCPPVIGAGVVLVSYDMHRRLTCFDLASGRIVRTWQSGAGAGIQAYIVPTGFMVFMDDTNLAVYEIQAPPGGRKRLDEPVWQRTFAERTGGAILGVSEDLVAVWPGGESSRIEVYSLTGGSSPVAVFSARNIGENPGRPVAAVIDGENIYALCSMGAGGGRNLVIGRYSSSKALSVQKFSLSSRELAWQKDLVADPKTSVLVMPPVVGRNHLAITLVRLDENRTGELHVLDAAGGQHKIETIDLKARNDKAISLGSAVMTSGRLCFETCEGIKVYGRK
jgi:outer membrane protein assembly factor BamB